MTPDFNKSVKYESERFKNFTPGPGSYNIPMSTMIRELGAQNSQSPTRNERSASPKRNKLLKPIKEAAPL